MTEIGNLSNHTKTSYPRLMLAAGSSGSGKTLLTCGLLKALKNRGQKVAAFKCGPDYIDPMFHSKVLHTHSTNLDTFFTDEDTTRYLFAQNAMDSDLSLMEGVMGYYDGLGGISLQASAYDLARVTQTPVVLVVNTKGMSLSVLAYCKGFLEYQKDSRIQGVILNRMSAALYPQVKERIEKEIGLHVYGYVPDVADCVIESRHLGLVLPGEVNRLQEKLQDLSLILEQTLEMDALLALAKKAPDMSAPMPKALKKLYQCPEFQKLHLAKPRIAVARDEAFCFIYKDNLRLLQSMGAKLIEFSPIHDVKLPEGISGLLLYGGYPELYARQLSENTSMLADIRRRIKDGLPCMAECGGFMYLHRSMEDMQGKKWPMAGVIDGDAYKTDHLGRFGYIELEPRNLRGHEFHYFDSTNCGESFTAQKPLRGRSWKCIHRTENLMAGFPHLYYYANPQIALEFCMKCEEYQ